MYTKIVVGTDGSASASIAVDAAIELARLTGATLHVVNAQRSMTTYQLAAATELGVPAIDTTDSGEPIGPDGQRICRQAVERAEQAGVHAEAHCVTGDATDALTKVAQDVSADLLVVGNLGMSGVRRFVLGGVPNKLSHRSPASLLIVDTAKGRT